MASTNKAKKNIKGKHTVAETLEIHIYLKQQRVLVEKSSKSLKLIKLLIKKWKNLNVKIRA